MNWFWLAITVLALERVGELLYARRQTVRLEAMGARRVDDDGMGLILTTHVAVFVLTIIEWNFSPYAALTMASFVGLTLFIIGDALRFWAIATLGPRWHTRVYALPDAPLVARGPFRLMRHPNYVGVVLVLVGFPLMFHLYGTAILITALNGVALHRRIRKEEHALGLRTSD